MYRKRNGLPALCLFIAALLITAPRGIALGAAQIQNTTRSGISTANGFIPGNYGGKLTDCRAPYHQFNGGSQDRTWDVVVLENAFVRVEVLPLLGGRVLAFYNKETGNNQFFENPDGFYPNGWGRHGWSATGGTEVMFPLDEHNGPFYIPWDDGPGNHGKPWLIEDHPANLPDGVRLTMVVDEDSPELYNAVNARFRVECVITLKDNEAAFDQSFRVLNKNASSQWISLWSNTMASPGPGNMMRNGANVDIRLVMPPQVTAVYDHNNNMGMGPGTSTDFEILSWPVWAGHDLSNIRTFYNQGFGYMGAFVANGVQVTFGGAYNLVHDEGFVKTFPAQIKPGLNTGLKTWHWGASGVTGYTQNSKNDTYLEIMSGPQAVFQEHANCSFGGHVTGQPWRVLMNGGEVLEWTDTYISPRGIRDIVHATDRVVMNFVTPAQGRQGDPLAFKAGVFPVAPQQDARVTVTVAGVVIWSSNGPLGPGNSPSPLWADTSAVLHGVPAGNHTIALKLAFDDDSTETFSRPIFIQDNPNLTPTPTATPGPTNTPTPQPTDTPTTAPTATPTSTPVPTSTPTPTPESSPTPTPTPTLPALSARFVPASVTLWHPAGGAAATQKFDLRLEGVSGMQTFRVKANYPTDALFIAKSADVQLGPFLGSAGAPIFPGSPDINNQTGLMDYWAMTLGPPYASGSGTVAYVTWSSKPVNQVTDVVLTYGPTSIIDDGGTREPTPYPATVRICHFADRDCNNMVDIVDIQTIAGRWNTSVGDPQYDAAYDVDQDGDVDIIDVQLVAGRWGATAPFGP